MNRNSASAELDNYNKNGVEKFLWCHLLVLLKQHASVVRIMGNI
jgi:hypothetical protein